MNKTRCLFGFSLLLLACLPAQAEQADQTSFVRIIPYTNAVIQCREVNPYLTAQQIDDCVKKLRQGFSAKDALAPAKKRRTLRQ